MEKEVKESKVSIIVPVYNVKAQLERCLESIRNQTYSNFECFLVDDGSTDGSDQICDLYAQRDNRFIVIHQKNAGLSVARNNAMRQATGEYVSFVDSDDYVLPAYLEKMVSLLEKNDCDIAKCDYFKGVYVEEKDSTLEVDVYTGRKFTEMVLGDQIGSQLWQYIFKKELWKGITSPAGRYAQDMMILHIVTDRAKKVAVSSEKLYSYYIDRSNSTSNSKDKKVKGAFDRAIAFKTRYGFAMENNYSKCQTRLMIHVLNFFNNAETLKYKMKDNGCKYLTDENDLREFLKINRVGRSIGKVGLKHAILGTILAYAPDYYSKIRGRK